MGQLFKPPKGEGTPGPPLKKRIIKRYLKRGPLLFGFLAAVSGLLFAAGNAHYANPDIFRKGERFDPDLLMQKSLEGSMQGKSGVALDLNGDGLEDLVVGAPYAQNKEGVGALLVYKANPRGFSSRPVSLVAGKGNLGWSLVALEGSPRKRFFAAGAVSGNGPNASLAGTVVIYKGDPHPQPLVLLEGENAMDRFGYALAAGDLNGDGEQDLVVGAPLHSPGPALYQQGAVYIYFGPKFKEAERTRIPATAAYGGLGLSLATGDLNGDGRDDLLLGAAGKVIVFYGPLIPASQPGTPDVTIKGADGGFGRSLAVLWDVNGDGFQDLAIGAFQAVVKGVSDSGRLFIVPGGPGKRELDTAGDFLSKIDGEPRSGQFASTLLARIHQNGDHLLAVGAVHADGSTLPMTGKVFLFRTAELESGAAVESVRALPGNARDMHLGAFLAAGEGRQALWLAAGAPTELANTGSVRLFKLNETSNIFPGGRGKERRL